MNKYMIALIVAAGVTVGAMQAVVSTATYSDYIGKADKAVKTGNLDMAQTQLAQAAALYGKASTEKGFRAQNWNRFKQRFDRVQNDLNAALAARGAAAPAGVSAAGGRIAPGGLSPEQLASRLIDAQLGRLEAALELDNGSFLDSYLAIQRMRTELGNMALTSEQQRYFANLRGRLEAKYQAARAQYPNMPLGNTPLEEAVYIPGSSEMGDFDEESESGFQTPGSSLGSAGSSGARTPGSSLGSAGSSVSSGARTPVLPAN